MKWIGYVGYEIGIALYRFIVWVIAPFHPKAKAMVQGRKHVYHQLIQFKQQQSKQPIWFHCASLGEFEQARPVLEAIRKSYPKYAIVVSFFSPSGYEIRKNYQGADLVCYLPFDSRRAAQFWVQTLQPKLAVFVKYDIWYHYLKALHASGVSAILISAQFRPDHIYFRWYGAFFRNMLGLFAHIFSQYNDSFELLKRNQISHISLSGDTRFDRVFEHAKHPQSIPLVETFKQGSDLIVAGSSYGREEAILLPLLSQYPHLKLVIAPHHIHTDRVAEIKHTFGAFHCVAFSEVQNKTFIGTERVLIIDNIGMLSSLYQYADMAFVGGGFGTSGLHNILEAAVYGKPVVFGPNNLQKFPESLALVNAGGAAIVKQAEDVMAILSLKSHQPEQWKAMGECSAQFVKQHAGATQVVMNQLQQDQLI